MLRHSTRAFALKLDSGDELRGVLVDGDVSQARALFGKRVSVQGAAIFRASGRLLRLDGRAIVPCTENTAFWSKLPQAKAPRANQRPVASVTAGSGVNAFFGRWAGTTTSDTDLLDLLRAGE